MWITRLDPKLVNMGPPDRNSLPCSRVGVNPPPEPALDAGKNASPVSGDADAGGPLLHMLASGVAAWAVPGLGHGLAGCRRHGLVVGGAVGFLWITGLWVGGLSVIDARPAPLGQRSWFVAQAGVGPSCLLECAHTRMRQDGHPPAMALGRGRDVGTLLLASAGLLNLMAVADAMLRAGTRRRGAQGSAAADKGDA